MFSVWFLQSLGVECSVLMGANLAHEVGLERFSEATVGWVRFSVYPYLHIADVFFLSFVVLLIVCRVLNSHRSQQHASLFVNLFNTPYFHVRAVQDVEGVELCGTLKNIVALGKY